MSTRSMLFNTEYEHFVLSSMLIKNGEIIPTVISILDANDFYHQNHQIIFKAIIELYSSSTPITLATLIEYFRTSGKLDSVGGMDYLYALTEVAHTTAYTEFYAKTIKEKAKARALADSLEEFYLSLENGKKSFGEVALDAQALFNSVNSKIVNTHITDSNSYFKELFHHDVSTNRQYNERSTGFDNIDKNQIFSSGLYVLGATPACGKTTFAWQLADQLAQRGEHCIFCSYEMSRLELFSKSVARELFLRDDHTSLTAADIRKGAWNSDLDNVISELQNRNPIKLIELSDETVDQLLQMLLPICKQSDKSPVVFIDYLQIIPTDKDNIKNGIDDTVRKLKVFQRETNSTFIVVSSFNRSNYNSTVSFESFKESGNIEYTADVVWALQLNIMNHFKEAASVSKIRQQVDAAKKQQPRQIQLKCLKNRHGNNYDAFFKYYSAHDYFLPCNEKDFAPNPFAQDENTEKSTIKKN